MRRLSFFIAFVWLLSTGVATTEAKETMRVSQVEPLSWWTDMQMPLQLMVHGNDLVSSTVTIQRLNGKKVVIK